MAGRVVTNCAGGIVGIYLRRWKSPPRTIEEALSEAERDHFLDCPEPPLSVRISAAVIDLFFMWILFTAIQQIQTILTMFVILAADKSPFLKGLPILTLLVTLSQWARVFSLFLYSVFPLCFFGGTPGKLLMGLRVIDEKTGKNIKLEYAILREWVGKPIGILSLGTLLLPWVMGKQRQSLPDSLAHSVVKKVQGVW